MSNVPMPEPQESVLRSWVPALQQTEPASRATLRRDLITWLSGLLVCAVGLVRVAYLTAHPETAIGAVPDDAFYYLKLAQNRAFLGIWSFDGVSPTSGFHLLHAYVLVVVDLILGPAPNYWISMLAVVGTLSSICLGFASVLTVLAAQRVHGSDSRWWAAPVVLSPPFLMMSTMMMESHLVVLAGAATLFAVSGKSRLTTGGQTGMVSLGLLSSLSRSDFVLFPVLLWLSCALYGRVDPARYHRASLLLAGGLAGLVVTSAHSWALSGTLLQSSVRTKLGWAQQAAGGLWTTSLVLHVAVFVLVATYAVITGMQGRSTKLLSEPLTLGCFLAIFGYGALYSLTGRGLQAWYAASLMVPLTFVLCAVGASYCKRRHHIMAAIAAVGCLGLTLTQLDQQLWPWQVGMLHAAQRLQTNPDIGHIGSWNAGILGVISGKRVTNLDGLVDDGAATANERGQLLDYLRRRQIDHVVDHADAARLTESGTPDDRLIGCLQPVAVLSNTGDPMSGSGPVTLLRLLPSCG